jgi:hypothetical protein
LAEGREPRVQTTLAEQKLDDLPVEFEIVCEQLRLRLMRVGKKIDEAVAVECGVGREVCAALYFLFRRGA